MMQVMVKNHGDGHKYMLERVNNYIERIRAQDRQMLNPFDRMGTITEPVGMGELPEELQVLLGGRTAELTRLLGVRTAELHVALASEKSMKDLKPEDFSLHYQRSLFSSMQSVVRETYQSLQKNRGKVPENIKEEVEELMGQQQVLLTKLKRIYLKKFDIPKIRIHGSYELRKVLLTGKDLVIQDFGGNTQRSFSERRIKRSPIRDVISMICSFHYTAYEGFFSNNQVPKDELHGLLPFAGLWAHYMSGFFMKAYLESVQHTSFIPKDKRDFEVLFETLILEKALQALNVELNNRPEWAIVPLHLIRPVINTEVLTE